MFKPDIYRQRRTQLREKVGKGLILFLGNEDSPMNYKANIYPFRQDANFSYFFGIKRPSLCGTLDADSGQDVVYGTEYDLEDTVWMGPLPTLVELALQSGLAKSETLAQLSIQIKKALELDRPIHFCPPYRGDQTLRLQSILGKTLGEGNASVSHRLIRAIVEMRSIKSSEEISEIEDALSVTQESFLMLGQAVRSDISELELVGKIESLYTARNRYLAYPVILSTHGETLHNQASAHHLKKGELLLVDAGATSPNGYASDITRVYPVGGTFNALQKDIYELVLTVQLEAIQSIRPGIPYKTIHLQAALTMVTGLKSLGLMQGNVESAVGVGAHALFFPHGLGHMLGLDVHDMEGLGEDFVGYDSTVSRSTQFGLGYLRLAKALQPGNVLTVEPGLYIIPALIDSWKSAGKFTEFVNYSKLDSLKSFGGIRLEDDVLVTESGQKVLGNPIPKTLVEIENMMR